MQKVLIGAVAALLVSSFEARAAETATCDQATLTKLEAEVGSLSGKAGKQAMKRLDKAKQAFKDGNTKKCVRLIGRVTGGKTTAPATEQPPMEDDQDGGDEDGGDSG